MHKNKSTGMESCNRESDRVLSYIASYVFFVAVKKIAWMAIVQFLAVFPSS